MAEFIKNPKKIKNLEQNRPKKGPEGGLQYDLKIAYVS